MWLLQTTMTTMIWTMHRQRMEKREFQTLFRCGELWKLFAYAVSIRFDHLNEIEQRGKKFIVVLVPLPNIWPHKFTLYVKSKMLNFYRLDFLLPWVRHSLALLKICSRLLQCSRIARKILDSLCASTQVSVENGIIRGGFIESKQIFTLYLMACQKRRNHN